MKSHIEDRLVRDYIRDIQTARNRAAHGEKILNDDAFEVLRKLSAFITWYLNKYEKDKNNLNDKTKVKGVKIEIVSIIGDNFIEYLNQALRKANSIQDAFIFQLLENELADMIRMHTFRKVYAPDYLDMIENLRLSCDKSHPYLIVLTDSALDGKELSNLFGSHHAKKGIAVVSTNNVPDIIIPSNSMASYFLYYFARYSLSFLQPEHKNHEDTRSCVFDKKINKLDLLKSMKSRSICDHCRKKLLFENNKMTPNQFQSLDKIFSLSGALIKIKGAAQ